MMECHEEALETLWTGLKALDEGCGGGWRDLVVVKDVVDYCRRFSGRVLDLKPSFLECDVV